MAPLFDRKGSLVTCEIRQLLIVVQIKVPSNNDSMTNNGAEHGSAATVT